MLWLTLASSPSRDRTWMWVGRAMSSPLATPSMPPGKKKSCIYNNKPLCELSKNKICSVQYTQGFCCYTFTWCFMTSSFRWLMLANASKLLDRYCCIGQLTFVSQFTDFIFSICATVLASSILYTFSHTSSYTFQVLYQKMKTGSEHTKSYQQTKGVFKATESWEM